MHSTTRPTTPQRSGRRIALIGAAAALLTAGIGVAAPANAATTGATTTAATTSSASDGWLRVGHLSPDTKGVDVQLSNLSGGATVFELDDVKYGQVSSYQELPAGTYVLSMRATDKPKSTPVISTDVTIAAGKPETVVAYGKNKNLKTKAFTDDLTSPADGQARLRLIQAATVAKSVDITTSTGTSVAKNAAFGTATQYATVTSGNWTLDVSGGGKKATAAVDLGSGTVSTLFVLDDSSGALTVVPVVDSASVGATPVGGVQTGGGGTAADEPMTAVAHGIVKALHILGN